MNILVSLIKLCRGVSHQETEEKLVLASALHWQKYCSIVLPSFHPCLTILPPEYKYIYGWNEHAVEVKGNDGYCRTIEL